MATFSILVTMDDLGKLQSLSLLLGLDEPLLVYDKSFIGTRSKSGGVSTKEAKDFFLSARNFPQVARLLLALEVLGLKGAAEGLDESVKHFKRLLDARLEKENPKIS